MCNERKGLVLLLRYFFGGGGLDTLINTKKDYIINDSINKK